MISAVETNVVDKEQVLRSILLSENLPTIPAVASRLISMLGDDGVDLGDVADLLSKDAVLSGKLLKVVNSAYYGFQNEIGSVNLAVNLLGMQAIQNLILSVVFLSLRGSDNVEFDYDAFWRDSLVRAVAAKSIYAKLDGLEKLDVEQVFLSGLLQNLGKLVLANTMEEQYNLANEKLVSEENEFEDNELEEKYIGVDHPFTSYILTREWGLPDSLVEPLRYHHAPEEYGGDRQGVAVNAKVCHLADILAQVLEGRNSQKYHMLFRNKAKQHFSLKVLDVNQILKSIHLEVDKAVESFGLDAEKTKSVEEVLLEANIKLSLLNLSYEEKNRKLLEQQLELEKLAKELAAKNRILENLAFIDGLTGVNNHRFFQTFMDKEINRTRRSGEGSLSLLMLDIDHFKKFNDTYGHQVGDFILVEFCRIISERLRNYDLLARYGGEEFAVVLPDTDLESAGVVAEKIRRGVEEHIFTEGSDEYRVTVSIGVAWGNPVDENFSKNDLIRVADKSLYVAKGNGRNRVELYRPEKAKKKSKLFFR